MCDVDESSEPGEFEMEERLDDEDSQMATSMGSEEWAEGDSQTGEVEALEGGEMEEEGEEAWLEQDEQADDTTQESAVLNANQSIYEELANDREDTLQHIEALDPSGASESDDEIDEEYAASETEYRKTDDDWRKSTSDNEEGASDMEDEEEEWLMDEALSEDEGSQSQNETKEEQNTLNEKPSEEKDTSSAQEKEALDHDDNNSTEDLLILLGGGTKRVVNTEIEPAAPPKQETEIRSTDKDDDMPWKSDYISDAKKKLVETSTTSPQTKLPSIRILPRSDSLTDVKKNAKLPNLLIRPVVKQKIVNQIGNTVIKSIKRDVVSPVTDVKKGATAVKVGLRDIRISDIKKRPREDDEQEIKSKIQKNSLIINASPTNRNKLVDVNNGSSTGNRKENRVKIADNCNGSRVKKEELKSKNSKPGVDINTESSEGSTSDETDRELQKLIRDNEGRLKLSQRKEKEGVSSDDGDSDYTLDSMSSSDEDERGYCEFTVDVRGERASEFLPLLGGDAIGLLTLEKEKLVSTLKTLSKERASLRGKMRASTEELRQLNSRLQDLNRQLGV